MTYPEIRRKSAPFNIQNKKTKEIVTVKGFSNEKKVTYFTKVFFTNGHHLSLRAVLDRWNLV